VCVLFIETEETSRIWLERSRLTSLSDKCIATRAPWRLREHSRRTIFSSLSAGRIKLVRWPSFSMTFVGRGGQRRRKWKTYLISARLLYGPSERVTFVHTAPDSFVSRDARVHFRFHVPIDGPNSIITSPPESTKLSNSNKPNLRVTLLTSSSPLASLVSVLNTSSIAYRMKIIFSRTV